MTANVSLHGVRIRGLGAPARHSGRGERAVPNCAQTQLLRALFGLQE
jgi:hypothetical protein